MDNRDLPGPSNYMYNNRLLGSFQNRCWVFVLRTFGVKVHFAGVVYREDQPSLQGGDLRKPIWDCP